MAFHFLPIDMMDNQERINQLLDKLELLLKKQDSFTKDINELREEIYLQKKRLDEKEGLKETAPVSQPAYEIENKKIASQALKNREAAQTPHKKSTGITPEHAGDKIGKHPKIKIDFEKFIGENLINKIGIAITIIGVSIGAKYSIEHDLISPLTRIILGYLTGLGLLFFGIKLKQKYVNYSSVLVSGAIAIMYFITFAAYSYYSLFPQFVAFSLMLIFTAFGVAASLNYNKQVIAHIGLVGAYAVPFLLSEGLGNMAILFGYMSIINIGILIIAFKKYWKPLYYSSFIITWLIYFSWFMTEFQSDKNIVLAFIFLAAFFTIFYLIFLAFKLMQKRKFDIEDILLLLANSFIFYGFGYAILTDNPSGEQWLGLFTLGNALIHFIAGIIIFRQKLADRNLFYFVSGLVLVFITLSIPVQLDGNWVTLLWASEALLLFWIGRTKNAPIYEKLSYILMVLAFFSIVQDWENAYNLYDYENTETSLMPLLNINFLTSVLFIAAFGGIHTLNQDKSFPSAFASNRGILQIITFSIPAILLISVYYAFRLEIEFYWNQLYAQSAITQDLDSQQSIYHINNDLLKFKLIWSINYSLLFFTILSFVNIKKIKNQALGYINLGLNTLTILVFLIQGLYILSELRESYLDQGLAEYYRIGIFNIGIRYISFTLVALLLFTCYKYIYQEFIKVNFKIPYDIFLYASVIWVASSELINWLVIAESTQSHKLGLSILWGIYSLVLIILGIWKQKKHLRIAAIALFGLTLIKLFFYDISHLDTIAKTIVFVSLGILLLLISFLYNKYKHIISDETGK